MPNLTGQSIGRYHILEQLGEGGMATVYKAYDTRLERNVAFKVLRTDLFGSAIIEQILKRFEREAKSLANLSHPSIVNILDFGEYDGMPYLVMEYLPSGTLKEKLGQKIPWQEALQYLLPVAQGLSYAHQHNVIHRDVKPANILFNERNLPVLTDFGIAKLLEGADGHTLTASGVGIGTPEYMAPEQGMGASSIDARADIYSLGIVLYEMVAGRKPYMADTPMAVVLKQMTDPLPRPTDFVPDLPEGVEYILFKALAKQPEDRYADMNALITAMESLLAGSQKAEAQAIPVPSRKVEKKTTSRAKASDKVIKTVFGTIIAIAIIALGVIFAPKIGGYLVSSAPANTASPTTTSTATPTATSTTTPTHTQIPTPTRTLIPPRWVTEFAEPILAAIGGREPDFQDNFSTDNKMWYGNKPVIEEGVLRIKEEHGYAKNYYFSDKHNFVLQVDIYPPTTCCVHVDISDYSIYLSPQGWGICRMDWDDCSGNIVSTNTKTQIILIVRGSQAGFYRKGTPVNYFENPGLSLNQVRFFCDNFCEFDNVKFWDLDKIPNLP